MAADLNQLSIIGRLGRDPEARNMQSGGRVVSFSVATGEKWRDTSGEQRERTQWHRVSIFNEKLGEVAEKYLRKGSRCFVQGSLQSRKYTDKDGHEREAFELVVGRFDGRLQLLDSRDDDRGSSGGGTRSSSSSSGGGSTHGGKPAGGGELDDDIPF